MTRYAAMLASLVLPGLGQLARARLADAALFGWAALWLHVLCLGVVRSGLPKADDLLGAFGLGAFGIAQGARVPELVVLTAAAMFVHAWAARDAGRHRQPE